MVTKINTINGYILAGGKSLRMGIDKGLILFNGKAIIQHVMEQVKPAVNKLVIVSNNPDYEKFGIEVISDLVTNIGPAGGIHVALNHTDVEKNFIVSCDMPFVTSRSIEFVISQTAQAQITLPIYHQKIEPMFGVYSKGCLSKWNDLIRQNIFKLQDLISYFSILKLNVDDNNLFNDSVFFNVNTKEDLEKAIKKLQNGN